MPISEKKYSLADQNIEWCVEWRMRRGESREKAECYCREASTVTDDVPQNLNVDVSEVFANVKFSGDANAKGQHSDEDLVQAMNEHISNNREPTPFEKCISTVMAVRQVDETEALKVCKVLFNDPLFKHACETNDTWTMGEKLHEYSLEHDDQWAWYRDEKVTAERAIQNEMARLRKESPEYQYSSDRELRPIATRNLVVEKEKLRHEISKDLLEAEKLTVGNLYGKTKEQIIAQDNKGQRDYGKTHDQIVEEIKQQDAAAEEVKKAKRKVAEGSN